MLIDVIMPKMGESIMDGRILKWFKKPGDKILKDEILFEISTDKVDTEVPSAENGIVAELLFNEGDVANVGDVVARIETDLNVKISPQKSKPIAKSTDGKFSGDAKQEEKKEESSDKSSLKDSTAFFSPLVLNIASKEGISLDELSKIKGTGAGSRVRKQDLIAYIEEKKSSVQQVKSGTTETTKKADTIPATPVLSELYHKAGVKVIKMDNIQSKMAEHMVMSVHTSPHVSAVAECDMSAVERAKHELEKDFKNREGFKLTYMPFFCEAVVKALKDFPLVNSSIDGNNILMKEYVNLGIAVAMDNGGLIVPVIRNADSKSLVGFAREIHDLAARAKIKKLTLEEIQDGTFTISNYGIFGNIIGAPLINQPQIAILGTGAVKKRAVVIETQSGDAIVIKPIMYLTLSFDHRLIDGALGGKFLMKIVEYLENYKI